MKSAAVITTAAMALVLGAGFLFLYAQPWPGSTLKEVDITESGVGAYRIGTSKSELLANNWLEFSTHKPSCSGWASAPWTAAQRECLLGAGVWMASDAGSEVVCPPHSDSSTTLHFSDDSLTKIHVHCSQPE